MEQGDELRKNPGNASGINCARQCNRCDPGAAALL
jgi:hypothetical protein